MWEENWSSKINNKNIFYYTIQIQMWQDCNLNCTHCWRDAENWLIKLDSDKIINNLSEFFMFLKNKHKDKEVKIMINLTWGEIFMYFDKIKTFFKLIEKYNFVELNLFTNWTLFTKVHLDFLEKYKEKITIQISIDWFKNTHDKIRWKWNFKKSIDNVIKIWEMWFKVRVQAVITQENINEIAWLSVFFCELPVKYISFRKVLWSGRAKNIDWIWNEENKYRDEFYSTITKIHKFVLSKWKILSLWCDIAAITKKYDNFKNITWGCWVITNNVLWIEPDWNILLCSRLPIQIWNIYNDKLTDIYSKYSTEVSKNFKLWENCKKCSELNTCKWWDLCDIYERYWDIKWHTSFLCK